MPGTKTGLLQVHEYKNALSASLIKLTERIRQPQMLGICCH